LPRTFALATGPFGALIAWCVAAGGIYTLARVFQIVAERKPDLDASVYAYVPPVSTNIRACLRPSSQHYHTRLASENRSII
jgi:hypothetical protein